MRHLFMEGLLHVWITLVPRAAVGELGRDISSSFGVLGVCVPEAMAPLGVEGPVEGPLKRVPKVRLSSSMLDGGSLLVVVGF